MDRDRGGSFPAGLGDGDGAGDADADAGSGAEASARNALAGPAASRGLAYSDVHAALTP